MEIKHSNLCPVSEGYTDCHCGHPMPRAFSNEQLDIIKKMSEEDIDPVAVNELTERN